MSKYKQENWTTTEETLRELAAVSNAIGGQNKSGTIRYCIRETFKRLGLDTKTHKEPA